MGVAHRRLPVRSPIQPTQAADPQDFVTDKRTERTDEHRFPNVHQEVEYDECKEPQKEDPVREAGSQQNQTLMQSAAKPGDRLMYAEQDLLYCQDDDALWGYLETAVACHEEVFCGMRDPQGNDMHHVLSCIGIKKRRKFAQTVRQFMRDGMAHRRNSSHLGYSSTLEEAVLQSPPPLISPLEDSNGSEPEQYHDTRELCPNCKQCKYCQVRFDQAAAQHDCQSHKSSEGQHEWEKSGLSYYGYYLNIDCGYCNGSGLWTPNPVEDLRPSGSCTLYIAGFSDAELEGVKDFLYRGLEHECTAFYPHEQGYAAEFDGFWHSDEVQDIQQRLQYRFPAQMFTLTYHRGE